MKRNSVAQRHSGLISAAVIAAHAKANGGQFRQRDVRFLIDLFSNWVNQSAASKGLSIQKTQVKRILESLSKEGYCRLSKSSKFPLYRLTRVGLLELLTRVVDVSKDVSYAHFLFYHYFIYNYAPRVRNLIVSEGVSFPLPLKLEVEALLDANAMLDYQLSLIERQLESLKERIKTNIEGSSYAKELESKDVSLEEIIKQVEKRYPYELNSEKPLSELVQGESGSTIRWELMYGSMRRTNQIWQLELKKLELERSMLLELRHSYEDSFPDYI